MYKNHVLHPTWICILCCKNGVMFCRWKRLPNHVFIKCARILATGDSRIEGDTCLFHRRAVFLAMAFSCFQWIVGGGLRGSFKIPPPSTGLPVGSQSGKFFEILGRCEKTHIVRRIASDAQAGASSWRQDLWVVGFDVAVPKWQHVCRLYLHPRGPEAQKS